MTWDELLRQLCFWGPGALIAGVLILAIYKLASKFLDKILTGFMAIGQDFVCAQKEQAVSLAKMAQGTEGLRDSINNFVGRDNQEHREMIILMKYTREQVGHVLDAIEGLAKHFPGARND